MAVSLECRILNFLLTLIVKPKFLALSQSKSKHKQSEIIKDIRKKMNLLSFSPPDDALIQKKMIKQVPVVWVGIKNKKYKRTIFYFHGGGYAIGSAEFYLDLGYRLAKATQAKVLLIDYRLAPEHPFPSALEDILLVYRSLFSHVNLNHLFFAGDSAGGGLVLSTLVALRDEGLPLPKAAVCFSPWTDLCFTGKSIQRNAAKDPYIVIPKNLSFLGKINKRDPLLSPLYADLKNLPPLFIQVGANEVLLDDSRYLAKKAKASGVKVEMQIWETVPHAWQVFAKFLPEGKKALAEVGKFIATIEKK